ncbi:VOC family protein [Actinocorallia sp. A-T 12471]|uniref:VOC family protein n=1 Tax=Actinocorallia sp. A-T 12471 TaxID=3089813 RepID=UPI0029CC682E|nr:VOC family protein [Actinocorallia sp. A-T 12471]MDX6741980.1 VOC family protein [Actinocorallia sp. A-T 12471]
MAEVLEYAWNTPSWVELATPDIEESKRFYAELFGWGSYVLTNDRLGDYEVLTLDGPDGPEVAGMSQLADPVERPMWLFFFQTPDIETALKRVGEAGGQVLLEGVDVGDLGRMGTGQDPEGVEFGLWQPYRHQGAARVDEPGALAWIELAGADLEGASTFYSRALDWRVGALALEHLGERLEWTTEDGRPVASAVSGEEDPFWLPYFGVADCEAAVERAEAAGGRVLVEPGEGPSGRTSVIVDPHGARLVLVCRPPDPGRAREG